MTDSASIVQRMWNYCNVLRDDGVSYGDYVEQLTYLLFLKMADEQTKPPFNRSSRWCRRGWIGLACRARAATSWRRSTGTSLESLGKGRRAAGRHLPQGPEQDSGPGQAASGSST